MPKYVDHDARRHEVIVTAWRLIAAEGIDAATTRRIAAETGYANGLLRYYFPSKDALIRSAFEFVFSATNERAAVGLRSRGLAGLRALATEILPLDRLRLDEARLVITFWQRALTDAAEAEAFAESTGQWRAAFTDKLAQAAEDGEIPPLGDVREVVDELLTLLIGAQIMAVFSPDEASPTRLHGMLEGFVRRLAAP